MIVDSTTLVDATAEEATVTNFAHDLPEADVVEQQMPVDSADEPPRPVRPYRPG